MRYIIPPAPQASVAVVDTSDRFPVRRIYCVGRNYAEHIREMGNDERDPPFYFTKPADAVVESGTEIAYPPATSDLHHEVELVLAIGKGGADIALEDATTHIWGAAVGIDLTRRDIQLEAKKAGRPWDMAKGFDHSAPIGALVPLADAGDLTKGNIWLDVNGERRQTGDLSEMIWSAAECVTHLSTLVTLAPGDLIMTGTPSGVAAIGKGDKLTAGIDGLPSLSLSVSG
ncbi:fumarylacetoacetate hydrolase family protein [Litoreibacter arenae]|uniref:Fumarylacetoacetate hydrolase family protein n=1 Tax=Litoreibacter arenae DSM 19593 TaxID=1123360 RepID=S9QIL1_9RHOB|nr:fumarylacetoacetate hydrolase family protein [Litoreibacter arenae]EPX79423.1 Fumarylacetoacetate hydrolase family protein [Litoreibacter arenae DSM 19593]